MLHTATQAPVWHAGKRAWQWLRRPRAGTPRPPSQWPIRQQASDDAVRKVMALAERFAAPYFPSGVSQEQRYSTVDNSEWTPGFWTGLLWLAYAYTQDPYYATLAQAYLPSFRERLAAGGVGVQTHDLGFLYTLSCVAAHTLTGHGAARGLALWAAELLSQRYRPTGEFIQAWGALADPQQQGRIIIDSAMNMPLLFWASAQTGNSAYAHMARQHLRQVARYLVRHDGSTGHTYYIDIQTGLGRYGKTHQGFADTSCWSRGQAWGLYGFALAYQYTQEAEFGRLATCLAEYFLSHLPADGICAWDLCLDAEARAEKDSSAAAIAAAGMLTLSRLLPESDSARQRYELAARHMLHTLASHYASRTAQEDGLLLHGVCNRPAQYGVDECCLWGDYFYLEGLLRLHTAWTPYW